MERYLDKIEKSLVIFNSTEYKDIPFILTPVQKEILDSIIYRNHVIINKHRQAGITTLIAAYLAVLLTDKKTTPQTLQIMTPRYEMAKILLDKIKDFIKQIDKNASFEQRNLRAIAYKEHVIVYYCVNNRCIPGIRPTILVIDELAYVKDFKMYHFPKKTIIASTPSKKENEFSKIFNNDKNDFVKISYPWYKNPLFNKFLAWTDGERKIPEPVMDDEGTVKYDPSRWRYIMKQGFKPTSPEYANMKKLLGDENTRLEMDVEF